jgi:hypothetical protein
MPEWEQRSDRACEPETHSFVLRARRDLPPGSQPAPALRIRLERVETHEVWHFGDVASALAELRSNLETIASFTPT